MKVLAILTFAFSLLQCGLSATHAVAQEVAPAAKSAQSSDITFRSSSNLVLVDVFALNGKTGLPDKTLTRDDFQVFDNGHPVAIKTFDSGAELATRPLVLWFVVQCNMQGWEKEGSGLFAGQVARFQPALKYLSKEDTVAVAHWCDDGQAQLDLLPTTSVGEAATALEQVLAPMPSPKDHTRTGELALQRTLQLITEDTRSRSPAPLPVLIFLYGDYSGMPKAEADHFINELLETSAIAFGLRDRRSPKIRGSWGGEQDAVANYIAHETGGEYLWVTPETYEKGLEEILLQLHFRYELGFRPEVLDGKRHKLEVKLADAAKRQHKRVRLRYRLAYVPVEGTK